MILNSAQISPFFFLHNTISATKYWPDFYHLCKVFIQISAINLPDRPFFKHFFVVSSLLVVVEKFVFRQIGKEFKITIKSQQNCGRKKIITHHVIFFCHKNCYALVAAGVAVGEWM